jgi:hypothetical protein
MPETVNYTNRANQSGGESVCLCSRLKFSTFSLIFFLFFAEKLDVFAVLWYTNKRSSEWRGKSKAAQNFKVLQGAYLWKGTKKSGFGV